MTKRGRPSKQEKLASKKNPHRHISISIPRYVLNMIEQKVRGKNRSEKIVKCVKLGYERITRSEG